jgi:hypothetical protein
VREIRVQRDAVGCQIRRVGIDEWTAGIAIPIDPETGVPNRGSQVGEDVMAPDVADDDAAGLAVAWRLEVGRRKQPRIVHWR